MRGDIIVSEGYDQPWVTQDDLIAELHIRGVRDAAGVVAIARELGLPSPEQYDPLPAWLQAALDKYDDTPASHKEIKLHLTRILRSEDVRTIDRIRAAATLGSLKLKTEGEEALSAAEAAVQIKTLLGLL